MKIKIHCLDCDSVILESKEMTAEEIVKNWTKMMITAPLNTGPCTKGCQPTYSDCNFHTNTKIWDGDKQIQFRDLKESVDKKRTDL